MMREEKQRKEAEAVKAAAASDLGGLTPGASLAVITIGLGTIAFNPECECVIFAAGDAKAKPVEECMHASSPVAVLGKSLPNLSMHLTRGAASDLPAERKARLNAANFSSLERELVRIFARSKLPLRAPFESENSVDLEIFS
jgi:hypothetical protein